MTLARMVLDSYKFLIYRQKKVYARKFDTIYLQASGNIISYDVDIVTICHLFTILL